MMVILTKAGPQLRIASVCNSIEVLKLQADVAAQVYIVSQPLVAILQLRDASFRCEVVMFVQRLASVSRFG